MDQMQYNLLFRWFVGLGIDDPVCVPTVFTKNRDRLLNTEIARKLLAAVLAHKEVKPLLSDEHFSVDGTLIEAWQRVHTQDPEGRASITALRRIPQASSRLVHTWAHESMAENHQHGFCAGESRYIYPFSPSRTGFIERVL